MEVSTAGNESNASYNTAVYLLYLLQFISYGAVLILQSSVDVSFTTGLCCLLATYAGGSLFNITVQPAMIKEYGTKNIMITAAVTHSLYVLASFHPDMYLLVPAAFCAGVGETFFWTCITSFATYFTDRFAARNSNASYVNDVIPHFFGAMALSVVFGISLCWTVVSSTLVECVDDSTAVCGIQNDDDKVVQIKAFNQVTMIASITAMSRAVFLVMSIMFCNMVSDGTSKHEEKEEKTAVHDYNVKPSEKDSVTLRVGEEKFVCNRFVLTSVSGYFRMMFRHTTFKENKSEEVVVTGPHGGAIEAKTMHLILDYATTNKIDLTEENIYDVSLAADYFEIDDLQKQCIEYLKKLITHQTWTNIFRFSNQLCLDKVKSVCMDKFGKVYKDLDFGEYQFSEIKNILEVQKQKMTSEGVFNAVLSWLNAQSSPILDDAEDEKQQQQMGQRRRRHSALPTTLLSKEEDEEKLQQMRQQRRRHSALSWVKPSALLSISEDEERLQQMKKQRRRHSADLIKLVDFKTMNTKYVTEKVCTEEALSDDPAIVKDICRTLANRRLLIIGGLTKKAEKNCIKYNPESKKFSECTDAPNICHVSSFASHGNKVIVAGGTGNAYDVQTYDGETNTWQLQKSALPVPRCNADAIVLNNKLYFIGGFDFSNKQRLASIDVFNLLADGSLLHDPHHGMPSMREARTDHAVVSRDGQIFIIGGYGEDDTYLKTCEVIDTSTGERHSIANLKEGRKQLAAVIFEDQILAIGGKCGIYDKLASVESYSFATRQWTSLPPMKTARYGHCACVHDGKVFVIGGNRTKSMECYDPSTKTWIILQDMNIPRWGSTVAQIVSNNHEMYNNPNVGCIR